MKLFSLLGVMSLNKTGLLTIVSSLVVFLSIGLWPILGAFVVEHPLWAAVVVVISLLMAVGSVFLHFFVVENCEDGVSSPTLLFYGSVVAFNLASLCFILVFCQLIAHLSLSIK